MWTSACWLEEFWEWKSAHFQVPRAEKHWPIAILGAWVFYRCSRMVQILNLPHSRVTYWLRYGPTAPAVTLLEPRCGGYELLSLHLWRAGWSSRHWTLRFLEFLQDNKEEMEEMSQNIWMQRILQVLHLSHTLGFLSWVTQWLKWWSFQYLFQLWI